MVKNANETVVKLKPEKNSGRTAPSWLDSSVGRALHRYRGCHGFETRSGVNIFPALIIAFRCVYNCGD